MSDQAPLLVDPDDEPAGSIEKRINERLARCTENGLLAKPPDPLGQRGARTRLALSDSQRQTLTVQCDHWGDEMLRLMKEREDQGFLTDERCAWMAEQVTGWYEAADAFRFKSGTK